MCLSNIIEYIYIFYLKIVFVIIMTEYEKKQYIEQQYNLLQKYQYKANYQILYNLIHAKVGFSMQNHKRSLYLDIKKFIEAYIKAAEMQDYGYDEVLLEKINDVIKYLEPKQKVSILHTARRMMYIRGYEYEIDKILAEIRNQEAKIAWKGNLKQKLYSICIWMSIRWWALLLSYFIYILILNLVLLPAPFKWMELFIIEYKQYDDNFLWNHIVNVVAIMTGNDDLSPQISPIGFIGMTTYIIGVVLFYLIIGNFVLRKLEDYLTLK